MEPLSQRKLEVVGNNEPIPSATNPPGLDESNDSPIDENCADWVPDDEEGPDPNPHEDDDLKLKADEVDIEAELDPDSNQPIVGVDASIPTSNIDTETARYHIQEFDLRLKTILEFIFHHSEYIDWHDIGKDTSWIGRSTFHQIRNASLDTIFEFFKAVIPSSAKAILGNNVLTTERIMELPSIRRTNKDCGVYLCYVGNTEDQGGLYVGSTTHELRRRMAEHRYHITKSRALGSGKGTFYRYLVSSPIRKPSFLLLGSWPHSDCGGWLVRLLETVMMVMLDTFSGGKAPPPYTISIEELEKMRRSCKLLDNKFERLNVALPIKQALRGSGIRVCIHCGMRNTPEKKVKWLYNSDDPMASTFLCELCYRYSRNHDGHERPLSGSYGYRRGQSPKCGPCSNMDCQAKDSKFWYWHPDRGTSRVLCRACHTWAHTHQGRDRPRHVVTKTTEERACIVCRKTSTRAWRWYEVGGGFKCRECYHGLKPSTKARRTRETAHQQCANCTEKIGKGGVKRRWVASIKEYFCGTCYRQWENGWLRVADNHLVDVDVRCEVCKAKYSVKWIFDGGKSRGRDANTVRPLICNCCHTAKSINAKNFGTVNRHDADRENGQMTYCEFRKGKDRAGVLTDICAYLKRVHNIDRSKAAVEAAGSFAAWLESNQP